MKKLLLTIGSAVAVVAPMATVVACTNAPVDNRDYFYKNRLENSHLEDDLSRYVDIENKMLLWDNIEEDGFDSVNLDKDRWVIDSVTVDENWLSNTDMNIPSWVRSLGYTFNDAVINNPIHIPKEKVNEWYDALGTSDEVGLSQSEPHFVRAFEQSTINDGITFEEGIKHIPWYILNSAAVYKGSDTEYKIHIPSSVEYIGQVAFSDMKTDVIDYDFSHLTNWYLDDDSYLIFSAAYGRTWFENNDITLPEFTKDLNFETYAAIFHSYEGHPNLIKYKSETDFTYQQKLLFTNSPESVNWSNIY